MRPLPPSSVSFFSLSASSSLPPSSRVGLDSYIRCIATSTSCFGALAKLRALRPEPPGASGPRGDAIEDHRDDHQAHAAQGVRRQVRAELARQARNTSPSPRAAVGKASRGRSGAASWRKGRTGGLRRVGWRAWRSGSGGDDVGLRPLGGPVRPAAVPAPRRGLDPGAPGKAPEAPEREKRKGARSVANCGRAHNVEQKQRALSPSPSPRHTLARSPDISPLAGGRRRRFSRQDPGALTACE